MRKYATTENGNILVELSQAEYGALIALQEASKGNKFDFSGYFGRDLEERDMSEAFGMIRAWALAQFSMTDFKDTILHLEALLKPGTQIEYKVAKAMSEAMQR